MLLPDGSLAEEHVTIAEDLAVLPHRFRLCALADWDHAVDGAYP